MREDSRAFVAADTPRIERSRSLGAVLGQRVI
jgi:hypothetical protein